MENFTHLGYEVRVEYNCDGESPLEWQGDEAVLVSYHNGRIGYNDDSYKRLEPKEAERKLRRDGFVPFRVFLYEHGQSCYKIADKNPFSCRWDSGWFGWFAIKPSVINKKRKCKTLRVLAEGIMDNYTTWVNGEVMWYEVLDTDGDQVDSCGGYYEFEDLKSAATSFIDSIRTDLGLIA